MKQKIILVFLLLIVFFVISCGSDQSAEQPEKSGEDRVVLQNTTADETPTALPADASSSDTIDSDRREADDPVTEDTSRDEQGAEKVSGISTEQPVRAEGDQTAEVSLNSTTEQPTGVSGNQEAGEPSGGAADPTDEGFKGTPAGELPSSSTTERAEKLGDPPSKSGIRALAAGSGFTLILFDDGTLWSLGDNRGGQLGDGTTTSRNVPHIVMTEVQAVATGYVHSLAVKPDGTLWGFGDNYDGQIGTGRMDHGPIKIEIPSG